MSDCYVFHTLYSLIVSYQFPCWHEVEWNDKPIEHMYTLSDKKSEVV